MEIEQKVNILIVDDLPQNQVTIQACLAELDQHLICASSAKDALRYILQYDFAVILLDVHMPIMDGFETAKLIRNRDKSSYTPIIFISALNKDEVDICQGYAMGAVDYIFKPINPIILRSKVKVFVDLFTKSTLAIQLQQELEKRERAEHAAHRQKKQLELEEINRLNMMEELTSSLAHELNQPLATITNYVRGCVNRLKKGDYQKEQLLTVLQQTSLQAERAGAVLHRIKNFVRKNKIYYETIAINDLILSACSLLQETIQLLEVELILEIDTQSSCLMMLDKIQIEQVLINILRNSIEALQTSQAKRQLKIKTEHKINNMLSIHIQDNGPGIRKEHLARLFDLYFTTKKEGMGIGLSICRSIVEAHGGNIDVKNNPQGGALFCINLPKSHSYERTRAM